MKETDVESSPGLPVARPDLSQRALLLVLITTIVAAALGMLSAVLPPERAEGSGTPLRQSAAMLGALLLLIPALFSVVKRSGLTASPPAWFVAHVLCAAAGLVLVSVHVAAGTLLSPPGVLWLLALFLVVQGILSRAYLCRRISGLFGSRVESFYPADPVSLSTLRDLIERKRHCLETLDTAAEEALFSPNLKHWLRHPWCSFCYARLATAEARLVGARRRAGPALALWRRVHIICAALLVAGLIVHVVIVTLFAGYAAGGADIYWWHLSAWGGP